MNFTTTQEIAKKGIKVFENFTYATVKDNNTDIGIIIGGELYSLILENGFMDELTEDLEMKKNEVNLKNRYKNSFDSGLSNLII